MFLLMESVRKVIADCVEHLRTWRRNPQWYLENRSREPARQGQLVCKARDSLARTVCKQHSMCPVSGQFSLTLH